MVTSLDTPNRVSSITSTKTVAVIPLVNMSADADYEYFSDGVSEEIIDSLSNIDGLKLISRGSSFQLKDTKLELNEIGEFLNVEYVITGTLRRIGSKVRMRVYLHSVSTGDEIWSMSYDQKKEDIFEIVEDIISNIWEQLIAAESEFEPIKPVYSPATRNLGAFDQYLQGLYYHNKWSLQDLSKAVGCYERAIKRDPEYFQAYSLMANAYTRLSFAGGYRLPIKSYDEAKEAANQAIALNPNYYRSYTALSYVYLYHKYDWEQALMMVNKALKLNESSSKAMVAKSLYYTIKGNFPESRRLLKKSLELDPLSFIAKRSEADNNFLDGNYEKAIEQYDELLEIDPTHEKVLEYKGWCVVMLGKMDEAIEMFRTIDTQTSLALKSYSQMGYAFAMKGDMANAERYLAEIEKSAVINKGLTFALDFAIIYTGLGDFDKAMDYLEEAVENKRSAIIFLKVNPIWDPLRANPRFKSLLKRLRLD